MFITDGVDKAIVITGISAISLVLVSCFLMIAAFLALDSDEMKTNVMVSLLFIGVVSKLAFTAAACIALVRRIK